MNKLPAYITDVASLDGDGVSASAYGKLLIALFFRSVLWIYYFYIVLSLLYITTIELIYWLIWLNDEGEQRPGKKKLNLAEYRTRREKQLKQQQEVGIRTIKEEKTEVIKVEGDQTIKQEPVEAHNVVENDRNSVLDDISIKAEPEEEENQIEVFQNETDETVIH